MASIDWWAPQGGGCWAAMAGGGLRRPPRTNCSYSPPYRGPDCRLLFNGSCSGRWVLPARPRKIYPILNANFINVRRGGRVTIALFKTNWKVINTFGIN